MRIPARFLGQSGWRLSFPGCVVYLDPYLSDSVRELEGDDLARCVPVPFPPHSVRDADVVLLTHDHLDHCDPQTLPPIASASPQAVFMGPPPVLQLLRDWGIEASRLRHASPDWVPLAEGLRVLAVPASHMRIERDADGNPACVGYLLECAGKRLYFSGDTCVDQEILDALAPHAPLHTAVLPVNEPNFYRAKRGIIGNMSLRDAFRFAAEIGARHMVPVHWDMFELNGVFPEEIRLLHTLLDPGVSLHLDPTHFNLSDIDISVVVRTFNEERHLGDLLERIGRQNTKGLTTEVVLVDSGSTDRTVPIAEAHGCHIERISKSDFTFGRSLNVGCACASGDVLVFVSGHCLPIGDQWLMDLCAPLLEGKAQYAYGRQLGGSSTRWSEHRIFAKYYPERSGNPQDGFFCNNANAALLRDTWASLRFDEELTGLEDMELAKRLVESGGRVAYVAQAGVLHLHDERWSQVRRRFEREAIALRAIMPQVHVGVWDTARYIVHSVWGDLRARPARSERGSHLLEILLYRWNQYVGSWRGNREHRKLSRAQKEAYFYPD